MPLNKNGQIITFEKICNLYRKIMFENLKKKKKNLNFYHINELFNTKN